MPSTWAASLACRPARSTSSTTARSVNLALREYAARHRRVAALDHYAALAQGWDFEGWQQRREAEKEPVE
jgi:hypothetical protein